MTISNQFYQEWEHFDIWNPGHNDPSEDDIKELIKLIDTASDERPIQKILENIPRLWLGTKRTGHGTWVIPQKRLGSEYVPDFLIASGNSGGLYWELVELESPKAKPFLKNGEASEKLRVAISQVDTWRTWLTNNLNYARNAKRSDGLGLENIHPRSLGRIIIGRRTEFPERFISVRDDLLHNKNVDIMSYDRFLEQVAMGVLRFKPIDEMAKFIQILRSQIRQE